MVAFCQFHFCIAIINKKKSLIETFDRYKVCMRLNIYVKEKD